MTEYVYLYVPRGYSTGYVFRDFEHAVVKLLKDAGEKSISDYIKTLDEWGVWHDIDVASEHISVDDGAYITKLELL